MPGTSPAPASAPSPPSMPVTASSAPTAPPMGAMPGPMGAPAAPGAAPLKAPTGLVDPFTGGLPRIDPPVVNKPISNDMQPYVPIYPIPGVSTKGGGNSGGGGSAPKSKDDDFFFGAVPPTSRPETLASLGRTIGWMETDGRGHATAYFEQNDGTAKAVTVGSIIAGRRVRAIERDYLVLVDEATGREEQVKFSNAGGRTSPRAIEVNVTPASPTWNGR
ncbi:MAG TPA: hypothetical protein VGL77_13460 [Armatimonadota bacterium]